MVISVPSIPQLGSLLSQIYYSTSTSSTDLSSQGWRPPQWAQQPPALTMTVQDPNTGAITAYVFDTIIRASHQQQSVITLNPVQTGAPLSDHTYAVPARLSIEIGMSDAMQAYDASQWADGPSKSVAAYQTLKKIQRQRIPVAIATRLEQYDRMFITECQAEETKETAHGLKAHVTFTQILTATVELTTPNSSPLDPADTTLPQVIGQTASGQVQAQPVPAAIQQQNSTAGIPLPDSLPSVAAQGGWTSTGTGQVEAMAGGVTRAF